MVNLESNAIKDVKETFMKELDRAKGSEALNELRIRYLGRKGIVTQMLKSLGTLPPEVRPTMGKTINDLKVTIEDLIEQRTEELADLEEHEQERKDVIDVTQPPKGRPWGGFHPVVEVMHELIDVFLGLGFSVALGPEAEDDFHNFEALNIPPIIRQETCRTHFTSRGMSFYCELIRLLCR